ncbi:MAG: long-chain-fatty-acid--CoA ligase [Porticoccaceae bacterium]|nr:MAG: long-chain-fatty-acid--CoA ligase [Porticoccaceae bacterium]
MEPQHLADHFSAVVARHGSRPAFTCLGRTLTYAQWEERGERLARFFHHRFGLRAGDRIALALPNLLHYPVAALAAIKAGLVLVNTNPLYTERELRHQLADAEVRAVVGIRGLSRHLARVAPELGIDRVLLAEVGDLHGFWRRWAINGWMRLRDGAVPPIPGAVSWREALRGALPPLPAPPRDPSLALLQYTGGTTGLAKGAMLSHHNLLANLRQVRAVLGGALREGEELLVMPLPLYHIFAFMVTLLVGTAAGAHTLLIPDPRDRRALVKALRGRRFTVFVGLNTLFAALCEEPSFRRLDFSRLHLTISGGMPLIPETARRWQEVTGCPVVEGYGLTETSPVVALNPPERPKLGTVGPPLPDTECRLVDGEGGDRDRGPGELLVRGPQVMQGYWRKPEETARVLDEAGWLRTGDVAVRDEDGYLKIVDRAKDMILVSGFNVYPSEVEEVISRHPDVVECAAVGVPDRHTGEAVVLYVVRRNPALTAAALQEFARRELAAYKVPRRIEFVPELPKSPVGKVLRRALREGASPSQREAQPR